MRGEPWMFDGGYGVLRQPALRRRWRCGQLNRSVAVQSMHGQRRSLQSPPERSCSRLLAKRHQSQVNREWRWPCKRFVKRGRARAPKRASILCISGNLVPYFLTLRLMLNMLNLLFWPHHTGIRQLQKHIHCCWIIFERLRFQNTHSARTMIVFTVFV